MRLFLAGYDSPTDLGQGLFDLQSPPNEINMTLTECDRFTPAEPQHAHELH